MDHSEVLRGRWGAAETVNKSPVKLQSMLGSKKSSVTSVPSPAKFSKNCAGA